MKMASIDSLKFYTVCNLQSSIRIAKLQLPSNLAVFKGRPKNLSWLHVGINRGFVCKSNSDSSITDEEIQNTQDNVATTQSNIAQFSEKSISRFRSMVITLPPVVFVMKRCSGNGIWIGVCFAAAVLVAAIRAYILRKSRDNRPPGSVADLVRRGQLRSGDRRGISNPLNYDDPFNNPFVKIGKGNSTVEMCGKVYRLAPVTLTEKEQSIHQKRRSRAYQWKRPTVFLKEGDSIPQDVDPDTVRWIPANHPFATTVSDIDQDLAQTNVYQKQGVPFRIRAEHEAMQRKLEALQNEEKLNNLSIDNQTARDFQRPYKFSAKLDEENNLKNSQENQSGNSSSDETQKS